jgi:hypothetical protein
MRCSFKVVEKIFDTLYIEKNFDCCNKYQKLDCFMMTSICEILYFEKANAQLYSFNIFLL